MNTGESVCPECGDEMCICPPDLIAVREALKATRELRHIVLERDSELRHLRAELARAKQCMVEAEAETERQIAALKDELREISAAINMPECDLTLTAAECIRKLKA